MGKDMVPKRIFFTKGVGKHRERLTSFELALRDAGIAAQNLVRDPASQSLHAIQPGDWELWQSDAELLRALRAEVTSLGVTKIALWRLGLEDPGVWRVLAP